MIKLLQPPSKIKPLWNLKKDIYREKWDRIAKSTEPFDPVMATAGVAHVYEVLGLKQPKIIYADSPMRGLDFDMEVRYGTAGKGIKDRILKLRDADSTIAGVLRMLVGGTAASWAMILVQFEDMDLEKIDRQMIL